MESTLSKQSKTLGALVHISILSKFIIPFGNYIIPLVLWQANTKDSFVSKNGKEALNFQLSLLVYGVALVLISIPFGIYTIANLPYDTYGDFVINEDDIINNIQNITGIVILGGLVALCAVIAFIIEIVCAIVASTKASEGESYSYPLTIRFIK